MFVLTLGLLAAFVAGLAGWRPGPWLYFAIAQFPIYLMPAMLKPLARRVAPLPPA